MTEENREFSNTETKRPQNSKNSTQNVDEGSLFDPFIIKTIYPNAASVFTFRLKPVEEIKPKCLFVLDTNVLLDPYLTGEVDLLNQCEKIYKKLKKENRLIIPGQVAREFAKNRTNKLNELNSQLLTKKGKISLPDS